MSQQKSSPPSIQEMGERIVKNLSQVQGYLDILKSEIDDPAKVGSGASREEWEQMALKLGERLSELEQFLKSKDWEARP